jgi:hypothetical protein
MKVTAQSDLSDAWRQFRFLMLKMVDALQSLSYNGELLCKEMQVSTRVSGIDRGG